MPYISTEAVAEIRQKIKSEFPDWKFSISRQQSDTIRVVILESPLDLTPLLNGRVYRSVHSGDFKNENDKIATALSRINAIGMANRRVIDDSPDYGIIHNYYFDFNIGDYDKPFKFIGKQPNKQTEKPVFEKVEKEPGVVNIVDYSQKAIAVIGDTFPIRKKLAELGGSYNYRLTCGPGWIFPKTKLPQVIEALKTELPQTTETIHV